MGKGLEQMVNFMSGVFHHNYRKTLNNKKTNQLKMGKRFEHILPKKIYGPQVST